jgi:hypothetical protein
LFFSCKNGKNAPDVSAIKVDATIQRFDQDFFDTKMPITERLASLQKKYGNLLDYFLAKTSISNGLELGVKTDLILNEFFKIHQSLYDSSQLQFKKLDWLEKDFTKAFQYYKHYFPNFKEPKLFTFVDGFYADNPQSYYGVELGNDTLVISLQMFLGKDFSAYDPGVYYDYLRERFSKEYILKNALTVLMNKQFKQPDADLPLVEQMIDAGKRIYLLDKLMPNEKDAIKIGYTKAQLKDCIKNEQVIWSYFVQNNLLFNTEPTITKEYIGENPFTKELGTDSPGNIGAFVGWQIVKKYVEKNKNLTPAQLMQVENKIIYNEAKYKP